MRERHAAVSFRWSLLHVFQSDLILLAVVVSPTKSQLIIRQLTPLSQSLLQIDIRTAANLIRPRKAIT